MRKAFDLFITPAMVDKIVTSTNGKIEETIAGLSEEVFEDSTKPYIRLTDECEMYALFGLMYFRGLLGQSKHHVNDIFSERAGHPVFGRSMSRNRFNFLLAHLCFDDHRNRSERWNTDRFAAFRESWRCSTLPAAPTWFQASICRWIKLFAQ